jgi:hypothetical protein
MKKHIFLSVLVLMATLVFTKCSKERGDSNYDGTWTGTTSQGKSLSFVVSGNKITSLTMGYTVSGNCSPSPTGSTTTFPNGVAINGNFFSINGSTSLSGTFTSTNSASGSFSINFTGNPPGCSSTASGTWMASR